MHLQLLLTAALLASPTLAQSGSGYFITIPTTDLPSATSPPTSLPTGGTANLPSLIALLPSCAIPCFDIAAKSINCATTDFPCLCKPSNVNSFAVNIGSCLTGGLGGKAGPSSTDADCSISNLSSLAAQICASVDDADPAALSSASAIAADKLSETASAKNPSSSSSGGQNTGGARPEGAAMGMLAVVAAYAVLAL